MKDEIPEERPIVSSLMVDAPVKLENSSEEKVHEDSTVGEKRNAPNSLDGPSAKRQRLGNSNLPEEAGHSQYEMTCVFLNQNGVLTTRQGCQGKKPEPSLPPVNTHILSDNKENSVKNKET